MFVIKDSFFVGVLYFSAIIGAGFATGREIMTFFGCYGYAGFIGLAIACFFIIYCGTKALIAVEDREIYNPHELNVAIGGKNGGKAITLICGLFAYSAYIIMLAGIKQLTNNSIWAVIAVSLCAYVVLYKGFDTLANVCGILAPLVVILIIMLALHGGITRRDYVETNVEYDVTIKGIIIKALLYSGYNVLTSLCVLGRCKKILRSHKIAIGGSFICGIMIFVSAGAILFGIVYGKVPTSGIEMPVLELYGDSSVLLYVAILVAMLVSAVTGLTGTCVFFDNIIEERRLGIILGIIAIPLSYISFGNLMDFLYPIFGFAGIFLMIMLALLGNKKV